VTGSFNVLLSSAGRRVALLECFRASLRHLGLPGNVLAADRSRLSAAFHRADDAFVVPDCTTADFVPAMLDLCRRHEVRLVVPTIDPELAVYARHRAAFAEIGTTVAVSDPETVAIGTDKDLTHRWLTEHRLPTVRQARGQDVLADPSDWGYPVIVKPRRGSASIGVSVVRDADELALAIREHDLVVQSLAPGHEHTVDVLVDRAHHVVAAVPRRRLEVRSGEVSKAITVRCPALEALAVRVCRELPGAYGVINVQVFVADTGELNVIEINPRFGGGFPLAYEAGALFPHWLVEEIAGIPSTAHNEWRSGLVMLRYDDAVFVDASAIEM
jgi:carbamoyl-phosphate synthase large subunit